jgi:hypothetical protein
MSILAEILHGPPSAPSTRNPSLGEAFDAWFLQACHREPERRFPSACRQIESLAEALGLPSCSGPTPRERRSSTPPSLDIDQALSSTTISHRSLMRGPKIRRTIAAGAALLLAVAVVGALSYRRSIAHRIDAKATLELSANAPADHRDSPTEVGGLSNPTPARAPAATAGSATLTLADTPTAVAAASPNHASDKAHPRTPHASTVSEPRKVTAPDPFKDQK